MISLPDSYSHIAFDSIDSTNRYALEAAANGEGGNLWITAGEQTQGKGRRGRPWSSERGNLFASLLLIDPAPLKAIAQLPLLSATAVHRAISDMVPPMQRAGLMIKWPNDVLNGEKKICGILLESSTLRSGHQAVVIGMGINCRTHPDATDGLGATDLAAAGYDVPPDDLFGRLAFHMDERLACWRAGQGIGEIREDWLRRARGVGQPIIVRLPDEELHGTFERLDEQGGLVLLKDNGQREVIYAGDVFWPSRGTT